MNQNNASGATQVHQPNAGAYVIVVVLTAAPIGLYLLGMVLWGSGRVYATFFSKGIWPPIALGAVYIGVWLHTTDELLRSYHSDEAGLTVHRPFLPKRRVEWDEIQHTRREHDRITLHLSGPAQVAVLVDYVTEASGLSSIIADKTDTPEKCEG